MRPRLVAVRSPSKTALSFVRVAESGPTEGKSDLLHGGGLGLASVPIRVTSGFFISVNTPVLLN